MAKKKGFRTVVLTIFITLIVLSALTYGALKFFLPQYLEHQDEIYQIAVRFFPLLVGFVLIVIGSMISSSKDDVEDEEDSLPPNAYEQQLFEQPSDDPSRAAAGSARSAGVPAASADSFDESQFVSVFDAPDASLFDEDSSSQKPEETAAAEETETCNEVQETEAAEEIEKPAEEPSQEISGEDETSKAFEPLLAAIGKLSDKFDDFTQALTCDDEFYDYDDDENEDSESDYYCSEYDRLEEKVDNLADVVEDLCDIVSSGKEEKKPEMNPADAALVAALTAIAARLEPSPASEKKQEPEPVQEKTPVSEAESVSEPEAEPDTQYIQVPAFDMDSRFRELTSSIRALTELVAENQKAVVYQSAVKAPAEEHTAEQVSGTEVAASDEVGSVEETPVEETPAENVASSSETLPEATPASAPEAAPANSPYLVEYECSEAEALAKEEFESSKSMGYDVSFAFIDAPVSDVSSKLGGCGSAFECKGKTVVILPFYSNDEATAEIAKLGFDFDLSTIAASEEVDFDQLIASKIR